MTKNSRSRILSPNSRISSGRIIVYVLQAIGLWQWAEDRRQYERNRNLQRLQRLYGLLLHLPLTFTFILLMLTAALLAHDLEETSGVLYMLLTELALVVKILNIWRQGSSAWLYMDELAHEALYSLRQESERLQWQSELRSFDIIAYSYTLTSIGVVVFACVGVLLTATDIYVLPFDYYVPFEWRHPRNYWYAWSYCSVSMMMTCISNVMLDMIFCYFMFHLSLLYKLIGWRLAALRRSRADNGVGGRGDKDGVHCEMREIFQLHMNVKRLTTQCESLVSLPVLAQIILSAFILCFSGYRLQRMHIMENIGIFLSTIQFVSVMTLQIFLPCYYGNAVTANSNALTNDIFNSDWTGFDMRSRKFMIFYMELLKRPATLKAGGFFQVGLPIFAKRLEIIYRKIQRFIPKGEGCRISWSMPHKEEVVLKQEMYESDTAYGANPNTALKISSVKVSGQLKAKS
ncbi:unnamed protein product [Ceratitis capitata]|uniref:Odorant receptor n=1 Tax=Ceratitis capitata TaxID=7213 RepID=A0A811U5B0_CERCA|nr:unnamed protein product [Ceratitis capitata]